MKAKLLILAGVMAALIVGFFSYKVYANHQLNNEIQKYSKDISKKEKKFESSKTENQKIGVLKSLIEDKEIKNVISDSDYSEVSKKYKESIKSMQKYFNDEYSKEIKFCTIENLAAVTSKDEITKMQTKLNSVQDKIKKNGSYTLEKTAQKDLESSVAKLTESYNQRCTGIDEEIRIAAAKAAEEARLKAEAEAKAKAEAEAKAKAEAEAKAKATQKPASKPSGSTSGTSKPSTSGSTSSTSKPSGSTGHGRVIWTEYDTTTGVPIKWYDRYSDGWYYFYIGNGIGWSAPDTFDP